MPCRDVRKNGTKGQLNASGTLETSPSAFNVRFRGALSEELQTSLSKVDNFALVFVLEFIVGFDLAVGDLLNLVDNFLGLADELNQALVF